MGQKHAQSQQFDNCCSQMESISSEILGVCGERLKLTNFVDEKDDKNRRLLVVI